MKTVPKNRHVLLAARGGSTLTEAVATIVTLLVLIVWLVPATAGVARSSKEGKCLSNLARIGYANLVYAAQDPADMALPVHPRQFTQDQGDIPGASHGATIATC